METSYYAFLLHKSVIFYSRPIKLYDSTGLLGPIYIFSASCLSTLQFFLTAMYCNCYPITFINGCIFVVAAQATTPYLSVDPAWLVFDEYTNKTEM